jgi:hypothetical protein
MAQLDSNENMLEHGFIVIKNYLYIAVVRMITTKYYQTKLH